ncbi:MAG: hypothetical protein C6W57_08810 [Caldibacillus debilis]|nr:hypothetical protein [Bacillaceae bacterium]OUM83861.1 MAG: hypothetical protein BAA03_10265 [Caldibacillus debilis]REJ16584.1 MAG: hypothetical protein C6W57_08810 [Caldibacillus debilis]
MILLPLFRLCREEAVFPGSKRSVALRFADGRKRAGRAFPWAGPRAGRHAFRIQRKPHCFRYRQAPGGGQAI